MAFLNLLSISYICFRLAPFILVCMLSLTSILYQDFKGIIYIAGLLITSVLAILISTTTTSFNNTNPELVCQLITLTDVGPLSSLPLSIITFTYTAGYMGYIIFKYKLATQNIPTLIIFPLLILSDMFWQMSHKCSTSLAILVSTILGMGCGIAWAAIIDTIKNTNLLYFNGISNAQTCSRPSKQSFRCVTKTPQTGNVSLG
jgi:hypothetical protein